MTTHGTRRTLCLSSYLLDTWLSTFWILEVKPCKPGCAKIWFVDRIKHLCVLPTQEGRLTKTEFSRCLGYRHLEPTKALQRDCSDSIHPGPVWRYKGAILTPCGYFPDPSGWPAVYQDQWPLFQVSNSLQTPSPSRCILEGGISG